MTVEPISAASAVSGSSHGASSSPSISAAVGGSSGAGSAGGGSSWTWERSNTAVRRKNVRGFSAGSAPASRQAWSLAFDGGQGAKIRSAFSPRRTQ